MRRDEANHLCIYRILILAAIYMLIQGHPSIAQSNDPFPSNVGDVWEYRYYDEGNRTQGLVRKKVIDRIRRPDGLYEVRYSGPFPDVVYDTLGRVYDIYRDSLDIWLDMTATQNTVYKVGNDEISVDTVYYSDVFGNNTKVTKYTFWLAGKQSGSRFAAWTIGEGIGVLVSEAFEGYYYGETLEGAIIKGVSYGRVLDVLPEQGKHDDAICLAANYPNPVKDYSVFSWSGEASRRHHIQLYDYLGRIIWDSGPLNNGEGKTIVWNRNSVQGGEICPGTYFYAVFEGGKLVTEFNRLEVY